ncbi:MAG: methyltransferase [Acidobacteriota bacterium]
MENPQIALQNQSVDEWLDQLAHGFRTSQVLFAACRLAVFDALEGPATVGELAARLGASRRGLRILLDALVGLGLLDRCEDRYGNTPLAERFLTKRSADSRVHRMLHGARLYERWAGLAEAVRTGRPVPEERIPPELAGDRRAFARAMADSARSIARQTAAALDLRGVRRLLDVGGGPGVYAVAFAERESNLEVTILDDAETLEVAAQTVRGAGLDGRIHLLPGNALEMDFDGTFDLVFVSNVLHIYSAERNRELVRRAAAALSPGGRLVLKDFFLDEGSDAGKRGPTWNLLFAVNMLVSTEGGDCYTESEVLGWCRDVGLELVQRIPLTPRATMLVTARP